MSLPEALPLTGLPEQARWPRLTRTDTLGHELDAHGAPAVLVVPVFPPDDEPAVAGGSDDGPETTSDTTTDASAAAPSPVVGPGGAEVADRWGVDLLAVLETHRATGKAGEVTRHPLVGDEDGDGDDATPTLLVLVGVGAGRPVDYRRAGAATTRAARGRDRVVSTVGAAAPDEATLEAYVVGAVLGAFAFSWTKEPPEQAPVGELVLAGPASSELVDATLQRAQALGRAGWTARALATVPSNVKSPAWLAAEAVAAGARSGLEVEVWENDELVRRGFGGIVGVGQASATPPCLIRLDYTPPGLSRAAARRTPRVVLVGKGITFDTGGLSIKPADGMRTMKRDMTGGGVVVATLAALAAVGCPVRVTGLVATAENAIGGNALRPGDVLRQYGGRTTEVTNTDAEGRLVLADALAYAVDELDPTVIVDVATLTGAGKVALGQRTGGLFATDDALAAALLGAGDAAGEPLWRLPLAGVYEEKLASTIADADNAPGGPGAITAALFLQHFVGDVPWAHLDIASVGDAPADAHEWTSGPTGFGARLLLTWLAGLDPAAPLGPTGA